MAEPLRPLLRQRTPDPAWYARVMAGSLRTLAGLLRDEGRLVLVLTGQRPALLEALMWAATWAGLGVSTLVQRGSDYRLELVPGSPKPASVSTRPLHLQIRAAAVESATDTIQARGEPVPQRTLHTAAYHRLAERGFLAGAVSGEDEASSSPDMVAEQIDAALEDPVFQRLVAIERNEELWWLAEPAHLAEPLCDRVERAAYAILQDTLALPEPDFAEAVSAWFPGVLTPEEALLSACLRAYGQERTPGHWQLRTEDLSQAREAECQVIVESLLELGARIGYRAERWRPFDVAWMEAGGEKQGAQQRAAWWLAAAFVVRWQAALSEALALSGQAPEANLYLVIPGGRAELVSHKLAHNPLWKQEVEHRGWRFIKYRHVRQLLAEPEVNKYTLRTIVGLDPIVERETAQIPLF
jgi:hypothetical protein